MMKNLFMVLCVVVIFFGIVGCPSSDEPEPLSKSSFTSFTSTTSTPVTTSDADSVPIDNGASPIPESATLILLGSGLVGLAVVGRKKIKK